MRLMIFASSLALACLGSGALAAAPGQAEAPAAAVRTYSVANSQLGTLLADPEAKAVLMKHIPELVTRLGDDTERAAGMTLKEMQDALKAYAPDVLSDAKLAELDRDLQKIPARN